MLRGIVKLPDKPSSAYCLNPQYIYNKYIDDYITVPCRKCVACQQRKSSYIAQQIEEECKHNTFSIFFTLTYDNEHINKWSICTRFQRVKVVSENDEEVEAVDWYRNLCDDKGHSLDVPTSWFIPPIRKKVDGKFVNIPHSFASVSVTDIQLFIKRLRRFISYYFNEEIRYAIVSEYGPKSFRPHYHGIIWTQSKEVADALLVDESPLYPERENLIHKAWPLCDFERIKPEIIVGKAARYVGAYCSTSIGLPEILRTKFTRPFFLCSRKPYIGTITDTEVKADILVNGKVFYNVYDSRSREFHSLRYPLSFLVRHFSLPSGNGSTSYLSKFRLFEKYRKGKYVKPQKVGGHFVGLSKYNRESANGNLIDVSPLGQHYSTDAFNYQDYRFYCCACQFVGKEFEVFQYDDNGFRTDAPKKRVKFTIWSYLKFLDKLYSNYKLSCLGDFYREMDYSIKNVFLKDNTFLSIAESLLCDASQLATLAFYPDVLKKLPRLIINGDEQFYDEVPELLSFDYISRLHLYHCHNGNYSRCYLRAWLVDYLLNYNPYVVRQKDVTTFKQFKKTVYKLHLSNFNESF